MFRNLLMIVSFLFLSAGLLSSQPYFIGKRTENLSDPDRNNRAVPTEIYYPALSAGNNATIAAGNFPLIVFGHGFVMSYTAYENISDFLVPKGYIIAFANTENGLSPNHGAFGADLSFIARQLSEQLNSTSGNFWFEKFNGKKAVMGHSMGGGASMLAASGNSIFDLVVGIAPAETNPSASAAAAQIAAPMLVFAGSNDGVTPPPQHQLPIYNAALNSVCRTYISITGGGHCFFANSSFTCELGEGASNPQPTINRAQQQQAFNDFSLVYLETFLKQESFGWSTYIDSLNNSSRISFQQDCSLNILSSNDNDGKNFRIYPQPADEQLKIATQGEKIKEIQVYNASGQFLFLMRFPEGKENPELNTKEIAAGIYFLKAQTVNNNWFHSRFMIAR